MIDIACSISDELEAESDISGSPTSPLSESLKCFGDLNETANFLLNLTFKMNLTF